MELLNNHILVKQDQPKKITISGLILPDTAIEKDPPNVGVIKFCGPGRENDPMPYMKGDRVQYNPHVGAPIEYNGDTLLLMDTDDVYVILSQT